MARSQRAVFEMLIDIESSYSLERVLGSSLSMSFDNPMKSPAEGPRQGYADTPAGGNVGKWPADNLRP